LFPEGEGKVKASIGRAPWIDLPTEAIDLTTERREAGILLGWERPEDDGGAKVVEYRVYRGTSPEDMLLLTVLEGRRTVAPFGWCEPNTAVVDDGNLSEKLSWSVQRENRWSFDAPESKANRLLRDRVNYFYAVSVVTPKGEGPWTDSLEVGALNASNPPRDLDITLIPRGVDLTWHEPVQNYSPPVLEYEVYRRTGEGAWELIGNTSWDRPWFKDEDFDVSVQNVYVVRAVNANGTSLPSQERLLLANPSFPQPVDADESQGLSTLEWYSLVLLIAGSIAAVVSVHFAIRGRKSSRE
jgi:hypothetical protein